MGGQMILKVFSNPIHSMILFWFLMDSTKAVNKNLLCPQCPKVTIPVLKPQSPIWWSRCGQWLCKPGFSCSSVPKNIPRMTRGCNVGWMGMFYLICHGWEMWEFLSSFFPGSFVSSHKRAEDKALKCPCPSPTRCYLPLFSKAHW